MAICILKDESVESGRLKHVEISYPDAIPSSYGWDAYCNFCSTKLPVMMAANREEALQGLRSHQLGGCTDG